VFQEEPQVPSIASDIEKAKSFSWKFFLLKNPIMNFFAQAWEKRTEYKMRIT
jgi:hypothetical protein